MIAVTLLVLHVYIGIWNFEKGICWRCCPFQGFGMDTYALQRHSIIDL